MARSTRKQETAKEAYRRLDTAITEKLERLAQKRKEQHAGFHADGGTGWGWVGDLAHIDELLSRALGEED